MAKYDPLREHLRKNGSRRVTMTFEQIGLLVGGLPESAHQYQAYWANSVDPKTHVWKRAWMDAGYAVESFDLNAKRVTFARR